jgi:hypothetical protein
MRREHRRAEAESCVENTHVQKFGLIQRFLVQTHGVNCFLCMHCECYAHACLLSVMHFLLCVNV